MDDVVSTMEKHVVLDGSMTRGRDEDLPTELANATTLLFGLPVPTHLRKIFGISDDVGPMSRLIAAVYMGASSSE